MVAIFTGSGLGTFNSSVTQLGQSGGSKLGQSRETYGVNAATGNLVIQALDESLVSRGFGIAALRTYNSRGQVSGVGQDGWVTGYERWVELVSGTANAAGSVARLHSEEGDSIDFVCDASGTYRSTIGDGAHDTLKWQSGGWSFVEGSTQRTESYTSADGLPTSKCKLQSITKDGATYFVGYDAYGRVAQVMSAAGYPYGDAIVYYYADSTTKLAGIATRSGGTDTLQVSFGYDAQGRLNWIQTDLTPGDTSDNSWSGTPSDNNGHLFVTRYVYASTDPNDLRIASVIGGDGRTIAAYTYEAHPAGGWRVKTVAEGDGSTAVLTTFTYNDSAGSTDVCDKAGNTWTYRYDANKQLIAILAPAVNGQRQVTSYTYDADGNVTRISKSGFDTNTNSATPVVEETRYRYDSAGNRIRQRDSLNNIVEWTYNQANQVLSETRYTVADGDALDADEAGNISAPSGALTTHYVYESPTSTRLRYVVDATGSVRELVYGTSGNDIGQVVAERRYLGQEYAFSGAVYSVAALDLWATQTSRVTGLSPRADSSLTRYTYDAMGRLQRSIEYTSFAMGIDGNAVGVLDDAATVTFYAYDAQGLLRQSIVSRGASRTDSSTLAGSEVTRYVYDGMGRLLSVLKYDYADNGAQTDPAKTLKTTYIYDDAAGQIRVIQGQDGQHTNRLQRIETRNSAGVLLSVSEGVYSGLTAGNPIGSPTTQNFYDDTGALRATRNAENGMTYFFYDAAHRLVAMVDETGAVARTEYDSAGHVSRTTRYATIVNTMGWESSPTTASLVFPGETTSSTTAIAVVASSDDRVATMVYDQAGRLISASDNSGAETSYQYDGAGRLVRVSQLGDWVYTGDVASLTSKMASGGGRPIATRDMRTTRMFYDDADRLVATLDAEGYLSETKFDAGGRAVKTIRYSTATSAVNRANGALDDLRPLMTAVDQVTRNFYDARGRQIGALDAEGYLTEYIYNEQSNLRLTREYANQLTGLSGDEMFYSLKSAAMTSPPLEPVRETLSQYNGLGQLILTRNHENTVTRYTYDESGRLVKTTTAPGTSEVRTNGQRFDVFGHLIGELSGANAALVMPNMTEAQLDALYSAYGVVHSYDKLGRRTESIDQLGNKTWYFYDNAGRQRYVVRGVEDSVGNKNAQGEVSEIRYNAFGEASNTIAYDRRIAIATPGTRPTETQLSDQLSALLATSTFTQFEYDFAGHLRRRIDVDGASTELYYNRFGDLTSTMRLDANGLLINQSDYSYDRRGLRTQTVAREAASSRTTTSTYDAFGRMVAAVDARGAVTELEYDRLGRQVTTIHRNVGGDDLINRTTYDAFDRVLTQTDAMGGVTSYAYNDASKRVTVRTPEGVEISTIHNAYGQTVEVRQPLPDGTTAVSTRKYDDRGLLVQDVDALGKTTTHAYDERGLLKLTTDATGRQVSYRYDAAGRTLIRTEDPSGLNLRTQYAYDAQGRVLQVTDPAGHVTTMKYDRKGQLTDLVKDAVAGGLNLLTKYLWDTEGHQLSVTEGAGTTAARTTSYNYDGFGRRTAEVIDPSGLALRTDYAYDANGNVLSRSGYGGNSRFVYDAANRLRYTVDALGGVDEIQYDRNGRQVAQRSYARAMSLEAYPDALPDDATFSGLITAQLLRDDARDVVSYAVYDGDGRVRFTINGAGEITQAVYDSAGRKVADQVYAQRLNMTPALRAQLETGSATVTFVMTQLSSTTPDAITRYFYDAVGRLIYTVDSVGGMSRLWYDDAGRVTKTRTFAKPAALATLATLATATIASLDAQIDWAAGYEGESRVYDGAGRLKFQIGADGALRETRYDAAGNVTVSLRYTQRVLVPQTAGAPAADSVFVADLATFTAQNQRYAGAEFSVYDGAGRLVLQMARIGVSGANDPIEAAAIEHVYDAAGREVAVYAHTQSVSTNTDTALRDRLYRGQATYADFSARLNATRTSAQVQRIVHDAAGREVYRLDGINAVLATTYTALGQVASTRRYATPLPAGTAPTLSNIAATLTASPRDMVSYNVYDEAGRLRFVVAADGTVKETRYDAQGRTTETVEYMLPLQPTQLADVAAGNVTAAAFGAYLGNLAGTGAQSPRVQTVHYDAAGRVRFTTVRAASGNVIVTGSSFDARGRKISDTRYGVEIAYQPGADADTIDVSLTTALATAGPGQSRTTRYFYDSEGQQRFEIDATGAMSEQRYDGAGRVVATIVYGNRPPAASTADTAALSAWVQTQATTDARISINTYNLAGQVIARTDALGQVERYAYDVFGNITQQTDRNGAVWTYEYDQAGRRTAEISPQVAVTVANTSASNASNTSTITRSIVTRFQYDGLRNITARIEDADGPTSRTTRYEYDNRGHQIRTYLPDATTGAAGTDTVETIYDALGLAVASKDALGNTKYKIYDNLGRVLYDVDAEMQVTAHQYNGFGEETITTRHANTLNTTAMQAAGWVPAGAITQAQLQAGLTISALDRKVETRYTVLGQAEWVLQGNVSYVKSDGTVSNGQPAVLTTYNAYGEVTKTSLLLSGTPGQADAIWAETYHYYDALGRETITVDAEGYVNAQQYNSYGDIWRKTEYANSIWTDRTTPLVLSQSLPPAMPPPGTEVKGFDRTTEYTFDALGRIASQTVKRFVRATSASPYQQVNVVSQYGYDGEGHVTSTTDATGTTTTTYDALGHITSVTQPVRSVVANNASALLASTANDLSTAAFYVQRSPYMTMQYDAFGNVSQVRQFANGRDGTNPPIADASNDRIVETRYDRRGRSIEERNVAIGSSMLRTYDAADRLVMTKTTLHGGSDHMTQTGTFESDITTRIAYDKTNAQISTETMRERYLVINGVRTAAGKFIDTSEVVRYNAFGEIVAKDDRVDTAFAAGTPYAQYVYDSAGRMIRSNADGGAWRDYGYDLAGRSVRTTQKYLVPNATGAFVIGDAVSDTTMDKLGRGIYQKLASNSDDVNQRPEIYREYDRWGNVIHLLDARGYATDYQYNDQNKLTEEKRPDVKVVNNDGSEVRQRPTITNVYDALGRLIETRDPNGNVTRYAYDNANRLIQTTDALGKITRAAYDVFDNERYKQDPKGYITGKLYDRAGRLTMRGDYLPDAIVAGRRNWTALQTLVLSENGDHLRDIDGEGNSTSYEYDSQHHVMASYSAGGVVKTYDYDLQGRKTRETNGDADQWRYLLGATASGSSISAPGSTSGTYTGPKVRKDRDGELVFENEQTWDYDYFGRLTDHNDLSGADYDYGYCDLTGQMIYTRRNQDTTAMGVSLTAGTVPGSASTLTQDLVDSSVALIAQLPGQGVAGYPALSDGEKIVIYYPSGLVKEIREGTLQNGVTSRTRYAYDVSGNKTMELTYTVDSSGNVVHLRTDTTYDSNGRISLVRQLEISRDGYGVEMPHEKFTIRYSYDAAGNRRRVITGDSGYVYGGRLTFPPRQHFIAPSYLDYVRGLAPDTTFTATMTLADGSPLPSWLVWDPIGMTLQGTPPTAQTLTLRLNALSSEDRSVTSIDITLEIPPTRPPEVLFMTQSWNVAVATPSAGWTFNSALSFRDPEGEPLKYTAVWDAGLLQTQPLPAGMHIDPDTGVISGLPPEGQYQIRVTATDPDNQSVSKTLYLSVGSSPWNAVSYLGVYMEVNVTSAFGLHSGSPPSNCSILSVNGLPAPLWMDTRPVDPANPTGPRVLFGVPDSLGLLNISIRAQYPDYSTAIRTLVLEVKKKIVINPDPTLTAESAEDTSTSTSTSKYVDPGDYGDGGSGSGSTGSGTGSGTPNCGPTPGAGYIHLPFRTWRSLWFDYDAMNRVIVSNGRMTSSGISIGVDDPLREKDLSMRFFYDDAGYEQTRAYMQGTSVMYKRTGYNLRGQVALEFDVDGSLSVARTYDNAGRMKERLSYGNTLGIVNENSNGEAYSYDADGRVTRQENFKYTRYPSLPLGQWFYAREITSTSYYAYEAAFDGRMSSLVYTEGALTQSYNYQYIAQESYLESAVRGSGTGSDGVYAPERWTRSTYDQWGRRTKVVDTMTRSFAYNMSGEILQRFDSNTYHKTSYAYVNGQQIAALVNDYIDLVSHMTAYEVGGNGVGNVTVSAGDTLRSIAKRVYGDEHLWYVLASANGLTGSEELTPGTTLRTPDVKVNKNDASTFKPYNPGDITGSTAPQLDWVQPPQPKVDQCEQILIIIAVVIVVAVATILTAGAMAPAGVSGLAALSGTGVSMMSAIGIGAVAGAVGAAAGELTKMALIKDYNKFDWGAVALGGITTAATAGLGAGFNVAGKAVAEAGKDASWVAKAMNTVGKLSWARGAAQVVVGSMVNYGANWTMNRIDSSRDRSNEKFNWAVLAASAVSAGVTGKLGKWLGEGGSTVINETTKEVGQSAVRMFANDFITSFVGSATRHNVASLLGDHSEETDYLTMGADAFGNAVAEGIKRTLTSPKPVVKKTVDYKEIFEGMASRFDENEDIWGNKRSNIADRANGDDSDDLASSDGTMTVDLRSERYSDKPSAFDGGAIFDMLVGGDPDPRQKRGDQLAMREYLRLHDQSATGLSGDWMLSGFRGILNRNGLIDPNAVEMQARGVMMFSGWLGSGEVVAGRLYELDPYIAENSSKFKPESFMNVEAREKYTAMQKILGVKQTGVYDEATNRELSRYIKNFKNDYYSSANDKFVAADVKKDGPGIVRDKHGRRINNKAVVDYAEINRKNGVNFNIDFLVSHEGGVYLDSYVPWSSKSSDRNGSGVTIVGGLDLGGKKRSYFSEAGVPNEIVSLIEPALGKKRQDALTWNNKFGIHLSVEQGNILQGATVSNELKGVIKFWNNRVASGQPKFESLTSNQQTVVLSRYFNGGGGGYLLKGGKPGMFNKFYSEAFRGNWQGAASALEAYSIKKSYSEWSSRLKSEARLLRPNP